MSEKNNKITISICMGSSCYSRGNNRIIEALKKFIEEQKLENKILIHGHLCEEKCDKGPILQINNQQYSNLTPEALFDILFHLLKDKENGL